MVQRRWVQDWLITPEPLNGYHIYSSTAELWMKSEPSFPGIARQADGDRRNRIFSDVEADVIVISGEVSVWKCDSAKDTFRDMEGRSNSERQP
jgi:hypothetical protein